MSNSSEPGKLDPTKMINQPALRVSKGRVWLVMGALFAAITLVPFALLAFSGDHPSRVVAIVAGATVLALYLVMIVTRIVAPQGPGRLRIMAAAMLSMAAVAFIGVLASVFIERAPQ